MRRALALTLTAVVAVSMVACGKPSEGKIEVSEYKGLEIYESDLNIDEQYEETIEQMLSSKATQEKKESGKVGETDVVNINYVGSIDGFEFEGGTSSNYDLDIANSTFIEGFAEGLVGKKVGKTVKLNLTFPEDYPNTTKDKDGNEMALAGKDVLFKVTINYRTVTVTPEYTDEFVKEHFSAIGSTTAEMDEYLKRRLAISDSMKAVWDDFFDACEVKSYPEEEVESYQTVLNNNYAATLQSYYGADVKTYAEACSMSMDEWDEKVKEKSQEAIKQQMVINEIAKKENIKVTAESKDYKKLALALAQLNGFDSVESLEASYGQESVLEQLNYEAVQGFIYDNIKTNAGERPTEEAETTAEETTEASK